MDWKFQSYSVILIVTSLISWLIALLAWNRRGLPGNRMLAILMTFAGIWSILAGLEAAVVGIEIKVFLSKIEYLGFAPLPALLLLLVLEITRRERQLSNELRLLIWTIPTLTIGLVFTNEFHHLIWSGFKFSQTTDNLLIYQHGFGFWLFVIYTNVVMAVVVYVLLGELFKHRTLLRRNLWIMLVGSLFPWIGSILYLANFPPLRGYDSTPLAFFFTGLAYSLGILRFHILDLVPIARDAVIEIMEDGALIFDGQMNLVDINPAGRKLFSQLSFQPGMPAQQIFTKHPELLEMLKTSETRQTEIAQFQDENRVMQVLVSPIKGRGGVIIARAIQLHDISKLKAAESDLQRINEQLLNNLEENRILQTMLQEQAIRDHLTGLFNRRYLEETLERELFRAERENYPVCLLMLDIDQLKEINDLYGHKAGDQVLQAVGQMLLTRTRRSDIPCRIGGDEFIIVLPRMALDTGLRRAEEIRQYFHALPFHFNEKAQHATFSIGAAAYPQHARDGVELMKAADHALYQAKSAGRNRVASAGD